MIFMLLTPSPEDLAESPAESLYTPSYCKIRANRADKSEIGRREIALVANREAEHRSGDLSWQA